MDLLARALLGSLRARVLVVRWREVWHGYAKRDRGSSPGAESFGNWFGRRSNSPNIYDDRLSVRDLLLRRHSRLARFESGRLESQS